MDYNYRYRVNQHASYVHDYSERKKKSGNRSAADGRTALGKGVSNASASTGRVDSHFAQVFAL